MALTTDLLSIVPEMYARNLRQRYDFRVWGIPGAPAYEVRLVWHGSTDKVGAILFLASDEASYITGVTMPVGGGDLG